ncbi:MAG: HNH endonuclease [Caulobacteraceae bacterium]
MIKLAKTAEPQVLTDRGQEWLNDLKAAIAALDKAAIKAARARYNHADIKEALIAETFGKCAYCESKILHITYGDIEHVTPKSTHVDLTFSWINLTLACDRCNTNKGNAEGLVDPYHTDPGSVFHFLGALVLPAAGSDQARTTEIVLKLNRKDLIERRMERIKAVNNQLDILHRTKDPILRAVLAEDIWTNEACASAEYSAAVRSFLGIALPSL